MSDKNQGLLVAFGNKVDSRIELRSRHVYQLGYCEQHAELALRVPTHQLQFRAACAEVLLVCAHQGQFSTRIRTRAGARCKLGQMLRGSPARVRTPRPVQHTMYRTPLRARTPKALRCTRCIELEDVVDHQGHFDATRAEPSHVVDHRGRLGAGSASNPPTWASNRSESTSNPRTWSTTRGTSMQRAPNPATWASTSRPPGPLRCNILIELQHVVDRQALLDA
jgi:hypothetical protein